MHNVDARRAREEILDEVGALLRDQLAAEEWGRILIEVVRPAGGGDLVVAGIDVEDIGGDEARVDSAFGTESAARPILPVLAKATEALCALEGVAPEDVQGGTFLHLATGGFEWVPGLVHAPSAPFGGAWDAVVEGLDRKRRALEARFALGASERCDVDVEKESIAFSSAGRLRAVARATLLGTYSGPSRTWAWGGYNESVPEHARAAAAALVDEILERGTWELSTPCFQIDERGAWALAAFVCDRARGDGVHCLRKEDGLVFWLLRDVREGTSVAPQYA
jgi:hypothetical protein